VSFAERDEGRLEIAAGARANNLERQPERARRNLGAADLGYRVWCFWIAQEADRPGIGAEFMHQL